MSSKYFKKVIEELYVTNNNDILEESDVNLMISVSDNKSNEYTIQYIQDNFRLKNEIDMLKILSKMFKYQNEKSIVNKLTEYLYNLGLIITVCSQIIEDKIETRNVDICINNLYHYMSRLLKLKRILKPKSLVDNIYQNLQHVSISDEVITMIDSTETLRFISNMSKETIIDYIDSTFVIINRILILKPREFELVEDLEVYNPDTDTFEPLKKYKINDVLYKNEIISLTSTLNSMRDCLICFQHFMNYQMKHNQSVYDNLYIYDEDDDEYKDEDEDC